MSALDVIRELKADNLPGHRRIFEYDEVAALLDIAEAAFDGLEWGGESLDRGEDWWKSLRDALDRLTALGGTDAD